MKICIMHVPNCVVSLKSNLKYKLWNSEFLKYQKQEIRNSEVNAENWCQSILYSSSGGMGILLSIANFFNASYFKRQLTLSSRTALFLLFITSMFWFSCKHLTNEQFISQIIKFETFVFRMTHVCFFRFQIVFLFDTLDTTTGCVAPVFQCTTSLFHFNNLRTIQTFHFQCSI